VAKILVVDDDENIRRLVSFTLTDLGHEVIEAANGNEAVAAVRDNEPMLMVLDVMMPGMDGFAVLKELRRAGLKRNTRVVMLTAKTQETDFVAGYNLGADDYLTKPFDPDELALQVTETLMLSPEQLQRKKEEEIERATLLSRIESAFGDK
jgi:two-component system, OmpR family, alkaline phosphatase synthesis response regulator PhoP